MHPPVHHRAVAGVLDPLHLAVLVDPVEQVAALVGQQRLERDPRARQVGLDRHQRVLDPLTGLGRDDHRVRLALTQAREHHRVGDVGLVDHDQLGDLVGTDLGEDLTHCGDLALRLGVRTVHDVQDEVGARDLLERGPERLDELVR